MILLYVVLFLMIDNKVERNAHSVNLINCSLCQADFNDDGKLNFFDISDFLSAFATNDTSADFTEDGAFDFFDVSAFLAAFSAGCP
jgi:hypothetical protein